MRRSAIGFGLDQAAPLQRLEVGRQGRAVHRQQRGDAADDRRLRPVERHQQRELAAGQAGGLQRQVEAARQGPGGALGVQAQADVADMQRRREDVEYRRL